MSVLKDRQAVASASALPASFRAPAAARLAYASSLCLAARAARAASSASASVAAGSGCGLSCAGDRSMAGLDSQNFSTSEPVPWTRTTPLSAMAVLRIKPIALAEPLPKPNTARFVKLIGLFLNLCQVHDCPGAEFEFHSMALRAEINAPLRSAFSAASFRMGPTKDDLRLLEEVPFFFTLSRYGTMPPEAATSGAAAPDTAPEISPPVTVFLLQPSTAALPRDSPEHALLQRWGATFYQLNALEKVTEKQGLKVAILPGLSVPLEDGGNSLLTATLYLLWSRTLAAYKKTVETFVDASRHENFNLLCLKLARSSAGYLEVLRLLAAALPPVLSMAESQKSAAKSPVSRPADKPAASRSASGATHWD